MNSLFHALNIGTLANWLGMLVFGAVAVIAPDRQAAPAVSYEEETRILTDDFTLGDVISAEPAPSDEPFPSAPSDALASPAEPLPAPPELPEIAGFSPLPEIPDLPAPAPKPAPAPPRAAPATRPTSPAPGKPASRSAAAGQPAATGQPGGSGASSGMSNAARLAAGRMPPPSYPSEARRNGQAGTVMVEFTVDASGRVISAHAKSPSPWPLLDAEAVRTVRRWRFPAGGAMTLQRPIVFQLR